MSRVGNAVQICKNHLEWRDDALLIYFAHEKTDQTQSKPGDPRHIYANPYQPAICPVLSLGIFFLAFDITKNDDPQIFSGSDQYCRFHKSLKELFAECMTLGCSVQAYGTHSIRKGAATFASSGTTACPSYAAISLRAGWSMGGVSSAYIHYHGAGDQHVGRTVSGLNPLHPSFAVLPPCFVSDYDPKPLLRYLFSNFDRQTPELQKVLTMTTASVIYHIEWLKRNLEFGHPLFANDLFRILPDRPFSQMVECRTWKPGDVLRATGIPPHVLLLLHSSELAEAQKKIPDAVTEKFIQVLEDRNQLVRNATKEDLENLLTDCFQKALGLNRAESQQNAQPQQTGAIQVNRAELYTSENKRVSRIPPDFKLPCGTLQTAWVAYCCWDDQNNIPPLRAIYGHELSRKLSARFASYRTLMEAIIQKAEEQGIWVKPTNCIVAKQILNSVDLSEIIPTKTPKGRPRRLDQLGWTTLANDYYERKQQLLREHAQLDSERMVDDGDADTDADDVNH